VFLDLDALNTVLDDNYATVDSIEDGDEYEADFSVQDPLLTAAEQSDDDDDIEDAYESASAAFDAVEADGSFDLDPVEVGNAEDQAIDGEMNLAPGTEFSIRVRMTTHRRTS